MVVIQNEFIIAKFNEKGAELKSLVCNNKEYIWHGDKKFWSSSAPVLFPICSGLKDDKFYYKNKAYNMPKHGYAANCAFEIAEQSEDSVSFLHKSNIDTLKIYPFEYELFIIYKLFDKKLNITYKVNNLTNGDMYFSIGAHEGFVCEGGIENCDLIFPKSVTLDSYELQGNLLGNSTVRIIHENNVLPLDYKYFSVDAIILKNIDFSEVVLKNRLTKTALKSTFEGFPYMLFWSTNNAPFLCIEPWCGITDSVDTTQDITLKEGIEHLPKGETFEKTRIIEIL